MTVALANHSVIKAIWYWGSAEVRTKHQHIHQILSERHPESRILSTIPRTLKNRLPCTIIFTTAV